MKVGTTVKWLKAFDYGDDVQCDIGVVTKSELRYQGTPLEQEWVTVRFLKPVFKTKFYSAVPEVCAVCECFVSMEDDIDGNFERLEAILSMTPKQIGQSFPMTPKEKAELIEKLASC